MEATRNALAEDLSVYSTLPKVRAAQAKTLAKCVPLKGTISELSKGNGKFHKETKRNFDEKRL